MTTIDKTIVTSMAEKYRLAEKLVFAKLKPWQQAAIKEDKAAGKDSGILTQFVKDVIHMAENMETPSPTTKPPVATKPAKIEPFSDGKDHSTPPWHNKNGANGNESDEESLI